MERKLAYGIPLETEMVRNEEGVKERIINIPLILIIVVYVTAMWLTSLI